jgi:hypothetical protein
MFERANWMNQDGTLSRTKVGFVKHAHMNGSEGLKNAPLSSHPGFAWASRREVLEKHGLFDYLIAGGADTFMGFAFMNKFAWDYVDYLVPWKTNPGFRKKFESWSKGIMGTVSGNVGYVEGDVFHLYHGEMRKRYYGLRHLALNQLNYNPDNDIELNDDMIFQWRRNANPNLKNFVERFFEAREDHRRLSDGP